MRLTSGVSPVIAGETKNLWIVSEQVKEYGGESSSCWCPQPQHQEPGVQGASAESDESTMARLDEEEEWYHHQALILPQTAVDVHGMVQQQDDSKSSNRLASFPIHSSISDGDDETSSSRSFNEPPVSTTAIADENAMKHSSSSLSLLLANVKGVWIEGSSEDTSGNNNIMSTDAATSIGSSSTSNCTIHSRKSTCCTITCNNPTVAAQGKQVIDIKNTDDDDDDDDDDDCFDFYSALSSVRSSLASDDNMEHEIFDSWSSNSSNGNSNSPTSPATVDHHNSDSMEMLERGLWEIKLERCLLEIHGPGAACDHKQHKMPTSMNLRHKLSDSDTLLEQQQQQQQQQQVDDKLIILNNLEDDPRYSLCHMALEYEYNDGHDAHAEFDVLYNVNNVYRDPEAKRRSLYYTTQADNKSRDGATTSSTNTNTCADIDNHHTYDGSKKNISDNDGRFDDDEVASDADDPPGPSIMLPQQDFATQFSTQSAPSPQCKNEEGSDSSLSTANKAGSSSGSCTPDCIAISDESCSRELSDHWNFLRHDDELQQRQQPTKWFYYQDRDDENDVDNSLPIDEENSGSCYETGPLSSRLPPQRTATVGQTNSSGYRQQKDNVSIPSKEPQDQEHATNVEESSTLLTPSLLLKSLSLPRSSSFLSNKSVSVTTTQASTASSVEVTSSTSCSVVVGSFSSMLHDQHSASSSCLFTFDDDDNDSKWTDSAASSSISMTTSMDVSTAAYKSYRGDDSNSTDFSTDMMSTFDNTSFVSARDGMEDVTDTDDGDVEKQMTREQQSDKSHPQGMRVGQHKPQARVSNNKSQRRRRQKSVNVTMPEESIGICCICQCQRRHIACQLAGLSVIALLVAATLLWSHQGGEQNSDHSKDNSSSGNSNSNSQSGAAAGLFITNRPTPAPVPSPLNTIIQPTTTSTLSPSPKVSVKLWSNDLFS